MISTERKNNEDRISQTVACHAEQDRLRKLYPWAVPGEVSKNAKKLLQQTFPGVKFSVTLDRYSGGSTLQVRWDLGPSPAEVERIVEPFEAGRWNILEESYEYSYSPERQAWAAVMGTARFVSVSRSWLGNFEPRQTRKLEREIAEHLPGLVPHWFKDQTERHAEYEAERLAETIVHRASFPAWFNGSTPWRLEQRTDNDGRLVSGVSFDETWEIVIDATFAPVPAAPTAVRVAEGSSVTVTENAAKNGVEIRFGSKPDSATLEALKQAGFRWSRFQGLWYARRTPEVLAFAHSLIPISETVQS